MIDYLARKLGLSRNMLFIIIGVLLGLALIYYFWSSPSKEGFNNYDPCLHLKRTHNVIVKTMDAIPKDVHDTRDNINYGVNYHDMQTRDIVIGDERASWCSNLNDAEKERVKKAIEEQVNTEVMLFDGPAFMERAEAESNADGIAYNDNGEKYVSV